MRKKNKQKQIVKKLDAGISVNNISHTYDLGMKDLEYKALRDFSFEFKKQTIYSIIGSTGSGKTTMVQHLNALIRPTEGEVKITYRQNDELIEHIINPKTKKIKKVKEIRGTVGIVFQFAEYQLFKQTIIDDVMFGPLNMGYPEPEARKLAEEALKMVNLPMKLWESTPFSISGGQKRRAAIAGILAMDCEIIVLDEPTAGLDPDGEKAIMDIIRSLKEQGKTIVVVTHNMDHVLEISDEVILMNNHMLHATGKPYEIFTPEITEPTNIELPKVMRVMKELEKKGFPAIDEKPTNIHELAEAIKRRL